MTTNTSTEDTLAGAGTMDWYQSNRTLFYCFYRNDRLIKHYAKCHKTNHYFIMTNKSSILLQQVKFSEHLYKKYIKQFNDENLLYIFSKNIGITLKGSK